MDIFDAEDFDPYIEANPPIPYDYTIAVNVLKKDVKKIKKLIKSEKSLLKYTVNHNDDILSKIAKFKTRKIQLKQAILFLTTQVYL